MTGYCLARLMLCSSQDVSTKTSAAQRQDITVTGHDAATGEVLTFKHPAVQSAFMFLGESAQLWLLCSTPTEDDCAAYSSLRRRWPNSVLPRTFSFTEAWHCAIRPDAIRTCARRVPVPHPLCGDGVVGPARGRQVGAAARLPRRERRPQAAHAAVVPGADAVRRVRDHAAQHRPVLHVRRCRSCLPIGISGRSCDL